MSAFPFDTVVFDIDGVLYRGTQAVPGVAEVIRSLERDGVGVVLATNNSTKTEEQVADHVEARIGYGPDPAMIVTSGVAAARHLAGQVERAYVIGGPGLPIVLEREGVPVTAAWDEADAVVTGLDRDITYTKLWNATRAIRGGARFIATNHDPTFPTADGVAPGAGAIMAAIERSSGATAEVMGKPNQPFGDVVAKLAIGRVAMIGDRLDSDMALARAQQWTAILVMSGVTTAAEAAEADVDPVLASAADLLTIGVV